MRANIGVSFSVKVDMLKNEHCQPIKQGCIISANQKHRLYVSANMKIPLSFILKIFLKYFGKYIISKTTVKSESVF